ncbi:MAG: cell wall-binding protein [Hungatella sp.]|nr:cell wall-binding protein [Hungatella sp.]
MKIGKQPLAVIFLAAVWGLAVPSQAFGAVAIPRVVLDVESDIKVGDSYSADDIEVTPEKDCYTVEEIRVLNEDEEFWWKETDIPKISVTLRAEDGYYFSLARGDIEIKGGTYVSGRKEDSYTLVLTILLPSMREYLGELSGAKWSSYKDGAWEEAVNAGSYEVRLYRDGKSVGGIQKVVEPQIDFGSLMGREGTYSFQVRAVNGQNRDKKTDWLEAEATSYVDKTLAEQLRIQYGNVIPDYITEPSQMNQIFYAPDQYGWIHDNGGWWYRNPDNSYTTSNWQLIDGKWYYFNSVGYMVTGWIDWEEKSYYCDPVDGHMLVNTMIPDGSGLRVDSTGAWIQ